MDYVLDSPHFPLKIIDVKEPELSVCHPSFLFAAEEPICSLLNGPRGVTVFNATGLCKMFVVQSHEQD